MKNANEIITTAIKSGFDSYGLFNEDGEQHEILTCTKGKYSGEVIDLYYNWHTGEVRKAEVSTQFHNQNPSYIV